jgi:hypothetical protein
MVEFALGIDGYPFSNEWMLYVFDGVPMVITLGALGWYHPVTHLQGKPFFEEDETIAEAKEGVPMDAMHKTSCASAVKV